MRIFIRGTKQLAWVLVATLTLAAQAHARTALGQLFVSPNGAGKRCDRKHPCSIEDARDKVRSIKQSLTQDLIIRLAPGRYRLSHPLALGSADSGSNGHVVLWEGSPDGTSILDGAIPIHGWTLTDAKKNIWRAPVPKDSTALQIYVNGVRAIPARHSGCISPGQCRYNENGLTGGGLLLRQLAHPEQVVAAFGVRWRDFRCRVQAIRGENIVMTEPCWHNTVADSVKEGWSNASPKGKPFKGVEWFENAYEFLGKPGQFYLDRQANMLYYVPRPAENLNQADVELPITEHLLTLHGTPGSPVHDIQFENLTFAHSAWSYSDTEGYVPLQAGYLVTGDRQTLPDNGEGMVRIPAAVETFESRNLSFVSDRFEDLGAAAIAFDRGTHNSTIAHSAFHDLAGGAIFVGDTVAAPANPADRASGNKVIRNTISSIAIDYRDNVAIMGGFNNGLLIESNSISHVPYTGISVGWGWNYEGEGDVQRDVRVRRNNISDFMTVLHDGGAIYTQAQSPGSSVTENYIDYQGHDNGNGIYLDERSRKYDVCGNVVWNLAPKMREGQWVSAWSSWSGDLNIHDNWSDDSHTALHNPGPTKTFKDNHLVLKELPPEAKAIIAASGVNGREEPKTGCTR
ncbi:hypothetical protein GOB94_06645 [Granulicella sp. 5B5]|uniref:right-handed parallel beta-helix repeat-containing protein n=1 Tax=Granulicella sp. 5B5 TaxID=1617967 RepID=UPI0015F4C7E9|nr:right-handed parallel beta-helix repeat-containing protein [Granulicella sp. 5B5]QMV18396.1 hypothetical protein GOB94_06645 [Granulicella sp. 5B5]